MLIKFGLKPWEVRQLPLEVYRWLQPIATCINAIENGQ